MKRRQKAGFLSPTEKLQNHGNKGKGKEKKKERGEGNKGGKEKKTMVALLVFLIATLEKSKKGPFGDNVIKNPARLIIMFT